MAIKLGAHMSIAGGCDRAVRSAHRLELETVQLFTKSTNQWKASPLTDAHVAAFRAALGETGIVDPVAHCSYLINLASPDDTLWAKSIDSLLIEVERCQALGIADLVIHPGAHLGQGEEAGLTRVARGLDQVHRRTRGAAVRIDLETTAGQGTCLGHRFGHLARIIDQVAEPERLGVCMDSCHIFAAGYSLGSREEYDETMEEMDGAVGLGRLRVWHLNDSRRARGSRVDRHACIGQGHLGVEPFRTIVNDPRFLTVPMILETPKECDAHGEACDVQNVRLIRHLTQQSSVPA